MTDTIALNSTEIDFVSGGLFFVPLIIACVKAGLAASGGTGAAAAIGASIGLAAAAAALAAEIIN